MPFVPVLAVICPVKQEHACSLVCTGALLLHFLVGTSLFRVSLSQLGQPRAAGVRVLAVKAHGTYSGDLVPKMVEHLAQIKSNLQLVCVRSWPGPSPSLAQTSLPLASPDVFGSVVFIQSDQGHPGFCPSPVGCANLLPGLKRAPLAMSGQISSKHEQILPVSASGGRFCSP